MTTLLIVDDDLDFCDMLRQFLESKHHSVLTANSASKALKCYARQKPEIIISDILMPDMDGIEFLMQLKKVNKPSLVGIIMVSGGGLGDADPYLGMARSLGASRVFAKPLSLEKLDQAINDMLGTAKN